MVKERKRETAIIRSYPSIEKKKKEENERGGLLYSSQYAHQFLSGCAVSLCQGVFLVSPFFPSFPPMMQQEKILRKNPKIIFWSSSFSFLIFIPFVFLISLFYIFFVFECVSRCVCYISSG
jgi:hypothetical protein